ncbi:MAG: FAD-dependent oxidoreductase, partial [Burkholderiales bacterium]
MTARLEPQVGEWIDRRQDLSFAFEGRRYAGYAGDTFSSALWAGGCRLLGRSFKFHRARGILSLANHDVNVMLEDGVHTHIRGDVTALREGASVRAVNTVGGVGRDFGRFLEWLAPLLPVGFYYKAFHTPKPLYPSWESMIRRMAGLGRINTQAPRVVLPKRHRFSDVTVVGSGAAGLAAALAAAKGGASVTLVDENPHPGGSLGYDRAGDDGALASLNDLLVGAAALPAIEFRLNTEASGVFSDGLVALSEPRGMTKLRTRALIVAAGAHEQPAVFRNNDLPGVMLGSAAQRLIYRYGVKPCQRAVVLTGNSDGYRVALDLAGAGVSIEVLVDLRAEGEKSALLEQAQAYGISILRGHCVYEAVPTRRRDGVIGALICPLAMRGHAHARSPRAAECDAIIMSVGWAPAAALLYQTGGRMAYNPAVEQFVPAELPQDVFCAGRANGVHEVAAKIADGERAGLQALSYLGIGSAHPPEAPRPAGPARSHPYPIIEHPKGRNFVDFDEDLQLADFAHAVQEGFDNIELLKRYTTLGMGPSQGKHSNMNAIRILAKRLGKDINEIGTTTSRPFYHPVPFSCLAGRSLHPFRQTPLHTRHEALGAVMLRMGDWLRPEYYRRSDMTRTAAIDSEVKAVRDAVGLIDVGTLGKIEISGPDAAQFLERFYPGRYADQKPGTTRYAILLDEAGVICDDGVVAKFDERRFYATTTSTGATQVYREMARWNMRWGLRVGIVNATGSFAAMNLAGP